MVTESRPADLEQLLTVCCGPAAAAGPGRGWGGACGQAAVPTAALPHWRSPLCVALSQHPDFRGLRACPPQLPHPQEDEGHALTSGSCL